MKTIIIFATFCILATTAMGQIVNPGYDSTLAKKLGADEYGMKWYVLRPLQNILNKKSRFFSIFLIDFYLQCYNLDILVLIFLLFFCF